MHFIIVNFLHGREEIAIFEVALRIIDMAKSNVSRIQGWAISCLSSRMPTPLLQDIS